ncbi:MAG: MFS transporter [Candidatus Hodarchaeota archaeon]
MSLIHTALGISSFPQDLQNLSIKYFSLQIVVSGIFLSYSWISLYYVSLLDSFTTFGTIVAIGMTCGAILDIPLGILTDRFGQRIAFCCALGCLVIYYLGMIFAINTIHLLLLEIIVGIYSALLSGSFIAWFMNSWEVIAAKENENELSFRVIMGNINFVKTMIVAIVTLLGGYILQQKGIFPQMIFFLQASIAGFGIILGFKLISPPSSLKGDLESYKLPKIPTKKTNKLLFVKDKYLKISPIFLALSILSFTSISFSTLIFGPLIYDMTSGVDNFQQIDINISFTSFSILLISLVRAISDLVFAIASRFSGRLTSFIKFPYNGILYIYSITYPIAWIINFCILVIDIHTIIKICLISLTYLIRVILLGLCTGLYWQFYLKITSSEARSSQESLYNTINLIVSVLGFGIIGMIIESFGFEEALLILFSFSVIGIILLIIVRNN